MDFTMLGGWVHSPDEVAKHLATLAKPTFAEAAPRLSGAGTGKTVLLYKAFKDVNGQYIPYVAQQIGDCVSHGFGHGVDLLECVQIAIGKKAETLKQTATEAVYGMARVDIGGGPDPRRRSHRRLGGEGRLDHRDRRPRRRRPLLGPARQGMGPLGRPGRRQGQGRRAQGQDDLAGLDLRGAGGRAGQRLPRARLLEPGFHPDARRAGLLPSPRRLGPLHADRGRPGGRSPRRLHLPELGPRDAERARSRSTSRRTRSGPTATSSRDMLAMQDSWALSNFDGYPDQTLPAHWGYEGFA